MIFKNKIEQNVEIIRELEKKFREAQDKEILPLSFFSSSIDILNHLKSGVYEIETLQFQMMQEHLKKTESEVEEIDEAIKIDEVNEVSKINKVVEAVVLLEEKAKEEKVFEEKAAAPVVNVLADALGRKIGVDFGKSLSLNDRFMFQRDFFKGNSNEMKQAFTQLDTFHSIDEALVFLNEKYAISWDSDSGIIFRELLEKRFA